MDSDRQHRTTTAAAATPTTASNELLIFFTSRLSSSSMKMNSAKSILSPNRSREASQITLSSSLSRRLRTNGSMKGGQASPMFPTAGKKRGCAFENPEPSSPKVTCIGQVRVKSKNKGRKLRSRSKRRNEVSFRKVEQSDVNQMQLQQECLRPHRNQKWVQLPVTICEALRTFGADFNCFLPCRSSCLSREKEGKTAVVGTAGAGEERRSCGAVFARWLVAVAEGEGKGREIELVVEEEEGREKGSQRRHVFEEIVFEEEKFAERNRDLEVEEEQGRVSICVPPKNALLLMRCRSDPVKMAALANRFWESPASKDEDDVDDADENEEIEEKVKEKEDEVNVSMDFVERSEELGVLEAGATTMADELQEDELENPEMVPDEEEDVNQLELGQETEFTRSSFEVLSGTEMEGEEQCAHQVFDENTDQLEGQNEEQCAHQVLDESIDQVEAQNEEQQCAHQVFDESTDQVEGQNEEAQCARQVYDENTDQIAAYNEEENCAHQVFAVKTDRIQSHTEEHKCEHQVFDENTDQIQAHNEEEKCTHQVFEESTDRVEAQNEAEEEITTSHFTSPLVSVHSESESESEVVADEERSEPDKPDLNPTAVVVVNRETTVLPDCLLLMMCEPKLSMEVSKETWVCSTDFIKCLPERRIRKRDSGGDARKRVSIDSNPTQQPPEPPPLQLLQPPRSSCSFPAPAAAASMATMIEQKLLNSKAYEPFVLTRSKSEPVRSSAKFAEPCFWKNRKLEPHRPATFGVGAAGVGF